MSEATQQMIKLAQRDLCNMLSQMLRKSHKFEIDLRLEGVSQHAIVQDEAKMNEINEKLEKLKSWIMHKIYS